MSEKAGKSIWREQNNSSILKLHPTDSTDVIKEESNGKIELFVQQNSPVNNELIRNASLNDFYGYSAVDGQLRMNLTEVVVRNAKKTKQIAPVCALCSFSYDDNAEIETFNRNGRYQITGYDRRVYNAIGTLWLNGNRSVSLTEIFSVMHGYTRRNPSAKQLQAVEKSLNKLQSIQLYIDLTEEVKSHIIEDTQVLIDAGVLKSTTDTIKSVVIQDKMLHFKVGIITSEQGREYKSIQIMGEPSLLTYNRAKGTLLSIPMEYIGLASTNATETVIAFQDYLLMRIMGYISGHLDQNRILYETMYRDSGVSHPAQRSEVKRDRDTVQRIMKEWQDKGLITAFHEIKEGRSFVGIEFEAERANKKALRNIKETDN